MADFISCTSCNGPKVNDIEAVETVLASYFVDPELHLGVGFDEETGLPHLFLYGFTWPEA